MSKKMTYALTTGGGTLSPNSLHDALLADGDYSTWKGTWNATDGWYEDTLLAVEFDATNVYLYVPDATTESTLLTKVDAQRV